MVVADAGQQAKEAKTEATQQPEASPRAPGWAPGVAIGASFNLSDARAVVGQQDGTSVTFGGALDAVLDYNTGAHEWRNSLLLAAGTTRTPSLDEFVKTADTLAFETIYLFHAYEVFGPFARFGLNTTMFSSTDSRATAADYVVSNLDGTISEFTGRRLALTDPFQPLTLKESLGVFWQPVRKTRISFEGRAGLGAQETLAEGGLAISDDDATDFVEVKELDDSFLVGGEVVLNAWGFFDKGKRASYNLGVGVLVPFAASALPEGDDRGLADLTAVTATAGLNAKLLDWASLGYRFDLVRNPILIDEVQYSNRLLLTIGAAFGSKAPEPEEGK